MEGITSIIISAVLSGVLATVITLWWQHKSKMRDNKIHIFTTLMANRYDITSEECVGALNMIDVIFYQDSDVRAAWRAFKDATDMPDSEAKPQTINDKLLKMLEVMAASIGYSKIHWDDIKQYYYPVGLSERKRDEAILRRAQIGASVAQIKSQEESAESSQVDKETDFRNQMVLRLLENPDGLLKLLEAVEKAQRMSSSGKKRK